MARRVAVALTGRDLAVVNAVAKFKQLSAVQIREMLFADVSKTPCDRALARLTDMQYLRRIERRMVGGTKGGSGQYVYTLGAKGFYMHFTGKYNPPRAVNYHSIAIADTYLDIRRMESRGLFVIDGISTEPDCWVKIERYELHPDLRVDVSRQGHTFKLWLEIDMATEAQRQIRAKLVNYWQAYNNADVAEWAEFPLVVFVAVDDERVRELEWIISQLPDEVQQLFKVTTRYMLHTLFL